MSSLSSFLSTSEEIIQEVSAGKMCIIVDDEARENEADLVISAQAVTAEAINFMISHGRGLVCLAMTKFHVNKLGLPMILSHRHKYSGTAFTYSIDASHGITTGISAHDRAHTISVAISESCEQDDIVVPGHMFPLCAEDGGVLVRRGHTEAAVDIARLAGHIPAGVICEILNEDGSMQRTDDLIDFAKTYGLMIGSVNDLVSYRQQNDFT